MCNIRRIVKLSWPYNECLKKVIGIEKLKKLSYLNLRCSYELISPDIQNIKDNPNYDLAISNNDINLFDKINATKKVAISHSIQSIEKFIRKGQLFAYINHKPLIALLSDYHRRNRNYLLKMFGSFKIDWASTVAVVVPSPATSEVCEATSFTI